MQSDFTIATNFRLLQRVPAPDKRMMQANASEAGAPVLALKHPLARMANHNLQARRAFFEGWIKSLAILDQEALLAYNS